MNRIALAALWVSLFAIPGLAQHPGLTDKASAFFDDSAVREIRIYFDNANWYNTMVQNHQNQAQTGDPYIPCRFKYGQIDLPKIGVRFKGNSSFTRNGIKRPFKFDFNEYDANLDFLGLKKLNLNTNDLQPDFMREKLFTDFAGKFVSALRAVHVRLYVNDVYYGLYTALEQPDKAMMKSRYGDNEDGNLYEANEVLSGGTRPNLGWLGADVALYQRVYQLETNEEANDFSGLVEFINILNNTPAAELQAKLDAVCDVEQMLSWLALNNLFVNLDSYVGDAGEYYVYDRSRDGKFTYIQWDHNESFGTTGDGTTRIANPFTFDVFWVPGNGTGTNARPLLQKTLAVDAYRRLYLRIFARMLREGFNTETFSPRITQLANLIREHVYADPNKVTTNAQFETALNSQTTSSGGPGGGLTLYGLNQFVRERYAYMRSFLNSQAQNVDVRLNELVAVNNGAYKDSAGDADPWVEVHNLGPGPVTTANFYLSDDTANPTKWPLPTKTLADDEFLVLWLDGETGEGDTHASFKLQAAGSKLYLYQGAGTTQTALDSVTYPPAAAGQTYVRLGSYGDRWSVAYQPTPGITNPAAGTTTTQPPTQGTGLLLINEFMADNEDTYQDPQEPGVFEDWFEVFNPGTTAVDMSGMYITDNLNNPTKWKVPVGVTIPARGYLVFIADGEAAQGNLHTSWSLSADGESLGIFQTDGKTLIDSYTFSAQQGDVSIGRATDGDGSWSIFQPATPGAANTAAYANWVTSAASFLPAAVAPHTIASLFGTNLTASTVSATSTPLPTTLGGVTITVTDSANVARTAPLFFVSAGQVNFQVPADTATGRAKIRVQRQDGTTATGALLIKTVAPGLFAANASGQGTGAIVALRVTAAGVQTYLPVSTYDAVQGKVVALQLSLGAETDKVYLILNGTGVRGRPNLTDVTVEVGGLAIPVIYAGAQGDFVGLDQINIGPLPRSLAGKGEVQIVMTVDNKRSNRVTVTFQ
jgi:uncharacterized protein (TIGR03437 family)